jgi:hypothetical protein
MMLRRFASSYLHVLDRSADSTRDSIVARSSIGFTSTLATGEATCPDLARYFSNISIVGGRFGCTVGAVGGRSAPSYSVRRSSSILGEAAREVMASRVVLADTGEATVPKSLSKLL